MRQSLSLAKWGVTVLLLSSLTSCEDIFEQYFPKPTPPPTIPTFPPLGQDIAFYALSGGTRLDAYNTSNAATRTSSVVITGLQSGETLLAIDFRPATGQLYGLGSTSRLYVINQNTGVARALTTESFRPGLAGNQVAAFDFNPTVDRIRVVTSTGQNLRLNPETGTVANTDGSINGATITGAAYTNNTAGATTTVLYDLDPATDQLYRQDPPNDGTLVPVGSLNLNITGDGGFDIDARTGTALGLYAVNGNPTLFAVDLTTGAARPLAQYAATTGYTGIAIPTRPVAYVIHAFTAFVDQTYHDMYTIDPTNPVPITTRISGALAGVSTNRIEGIDFRPATGQLYALVRNLRTNAGHIYTLNPASGAATLVAPVSVALEGSTFGFDFNPVADRIRITSNTGQNLRVNPADGVTIADSRLNPGNPDVTAAAYDNNAVGATATTLYVIDNTMGKLYQQNPPNAGTLTEVGNLGIGPVLSANGFDIGATSNRGYAMLHTNRSFYDFYMIDLATGVARVTTTPGSFNNKGGTTVGLAVGLGF